MATIDNVNHPYHYAEQGAYECIDYIAIVITPYQGVVAGDLQNILKYLWRADNKNGIEDLKKAAWYARHIRKQIYSQRDDMLRIARVWRTACIARTPQEETVLQSVIGQCESYMTDREKKLYREILAVVLDGNLYRLVEGPERLVAAVDGWISIYEEERKKKQDERGDRLHVV